RLLATSSRISQRYASTTSPATVSAHARVGESNTTSTFELRSAVARSSERSDASTSAIITPRLRRTAMVPQGRKGSPEGKPALHLRAPVSSPSVALAHLVDVAGVCDSRANHVFHP